MTLCEPWFDFLSGDSRLRQQLEKGMDLQEISRQWLPALEAFKAIRKKYLLYAQSV